MKKRILMVLLIALMAAGVAFAQSEFKLSAGVGGFIGGDNGGGVEASASMSEAGHTMSMKEKIEMPYFGGGGYMFLDATYAELSIGFFVGKITPEYAFEVKYDGIKISPPVEAVPTYTVSSLNLGLFGKYPFVISDSFSFFPLLGIEYQAALSVKDEDGIEYRRMTDGAKASGDWSSLWFKVGVGTDFSFTESLYLRLDVLYGIRLPSKAEKDIANFMKSSMREESEGPPMTIDAKTLLGHGLTAKLAIGFKF